MTFEARKGEVLVLLGAKGSGKTTILLMLEGSAKPTSGSARVLGLTPSDPKDAQRLKTKVGIVEREATALPRLTVKENLNFFASIYGKKDSVPKLLDLVGLEPYSRELFSRLDRAGKRKLGFALALANDPEVVFLDEPTLGAEIEDKRSTWSLVRSLAKEGKTVILATDSPEEAQGAGDRIGVVAHGGLAAFDAPPGLLASFGGGREAIFRGGGDAAFGTLRRFFDNVSMEGTDVVLPFDNIRDLEVALRELVGRGIGTEVDIRTSTLGDLLRRLMETRPQEARTAN